MQPQHKAKPDKKHAELSPSSCSRWTACPGSIARIRQCPPEKDSPAALEGTAAHSLAEECLKNGINTDDYPSQEVTVKEGQSYPVSEEMRDAVQVYLDTIWASTCSGEAVIAIEKWLDLSWLYPDITGTTDCYIYTPSKYLLQVHDYKHGVKHIVDPEWNPQQMIYALGAIHDLWLSQTEVTRKALPAWEIVKTVELVIVQPRGMGTDETVRRWTISAKDLYHWGLNVLKPAAEATKNPSARLSAGDHCCFCPVRAVCSEFVSHTCALARTNFDNPVLPAPHEITPQDIVKVLEFSDLISSWAGEVKNYAMSQLEIGVNIPGFKLVAKRATRKWINELMAIQKLMGHLGDKAFEKKVLSVAQAEKTLKKAGLSAEACLNGLFLKESSGNTLVADSDGRKEISEPALDAFWDDMDFLN